MCTGLHHKPKNKSLLGQVHWDFQVVIAVVVVQSLSHVQLFVTPRTAASQASQSFTISRSLLKFMATELVMPSNHVILCHPFSYPQSFPISGFFPVSQIVTSSDQSIGALASASVLPMNIQGWFPWILKMKLNFPLSLSPLTCHFYMSILMPKCISNPALSHCLFYHSLNSGPPNLASQLLI